MNRALLSIALFSALLAGCSAPPATETSASTEVVECVYCQAEKSKPDMELKDGKYVCKACAQIH